MLRTPAPKITQDITALNDLIDNMWETMYATNGVGLAAPQVNLSLQLFVVDTIQMFQKNTEFKDRYPTDFPGIKDVFINPEIIEEAGQLWHYEEGCLSIPNVFAMVERKQHLTLRYYDANMVLQTKAFTGISARVIFHEYDHLHGKLFIDKISSLKKKLIQSKLNDISKGKMEVSYRMM